MKKGFEARQRLKPGVKEHQSLRSLSQLFRSRNLWIVGLPRLTSQRLSCYVRRTLQEGTMAHFMNRPRLVRVRTYTRVRFGKPELVCQHWRSPPR